MVVTGELVADLGTKKFIPSIRQTGHPRITPACISTRLFVDFSDDADFAHKLEELARSIQESPKFEKPSIGQNPFAAPKASSVTVMANAGVAPDPVGPSEIYEQALSYANAGNFAKWRELIHKEKASAGVALHQWRARNERSLPRLEKDLPGFFLPAVATHSGLFAAAFGAFDSTDERFHNQLSLLDWIRNPKDWMRSGVTVWVELPDLVLFTYQALIGALAMSRQRPELALNLAITPMTNLYYSNEAQPLFKNSRLTGWPESLTHHCSIAWAFLQLLAKDWEWLWKLFGREEDTLAAIIAYYLFLNTVDFISAFKARTSANPEFRELEPPLFCVTGRDDVQKRAQSLYFASANFIGDLLLENGISDEELPALWNLWMQRCWKWVNDIYRNGWSRSALVIGHGDLPKMLFRGPQKRLIE